MRLTLTEIIHKELQKKTVEELFPMANINFNVLMDSRINQSQVKSSSVILRLRKLSIQVSCSIHRNMDLVLKMMMMEIFDIKVNLGLTNDKVGGKLKSIWDNLKMTCTMDGES